MGAAYMLLPLKILRSAALVLLFAAIGTAKAQVITRPHLEAAGTVIVWGADAAGAAGRAPVVADWIINTGTGATAATSGDHDLIAGNVFTVVTGSLVPVTDGVTNPVGAPFRVQSPNGQPTFSTDTNNNGGTDQFDTFSPFGMRATTDIDTTNLVLNTSFYVASNTAFAIDVQATPLAGTSAAQFNNMRVTWSTTLSGTDGGISFGSAAQYPHTGGANGGRNLNNTRLSTIATPTRAYTSTRRTALTPGSISAQSVRFDLDYTYNFGTYDLSRGLFDIGATVVYTVFVP
jgi:hypothetical protein